MVGLDEYVACVHTSGCCAYLPLLARIDLSAALDLSGFSFNLVWQPYGK